jgi:hypothetical protein
MVTVTVGADGMVPRTGWAAAVVVFDRSRRMSGIQFDSTSRRIGGGDEDEHSDEQRDERRHDAMPVRRPNHAALYHGSALEQHA